MRIFNLPLGHRPLISEIDGSDILCVWHANANRKYKVEGKNHKLSYKHSILARLNVETGNWHITFHRELFSATTRPLISEIDGSDILCVWHANANRKYKVEGKNHKLSYKHSILARLNDCKIVYDFYLLL